MGEAQKLCLTPDTSPLCSLAPQTDQFQPAKRPRPLILVHFTDGNTCVRSFRLYLKVLFGLCDRMRGVPRVIKHYIVMVWV